MFNKVSKDIYHKVGNHFLKDFFEKGTQSELGNSRQRFLVFYMSSKTTLQKASNNCSFLEGMRRKEGI